MLPSQMYRELQALPFGFLDELLEARRYAEAKSIVAHAKSVTDIPVSPWTEWAQRIELRLAEEAMVGG